MGNRKRGNGEGSIFKMKDGRWRGAISLGWRTNAQGKEVWKRRVITASTRYAVAEEMKVVLAEQQDGGSIDPSRQTVANFLACWLRDVVKPSVKPKTYRTYADLVKLHIAPTIGKYQLTKLTAPNIRALINEKLATPQLSRKKPKKDELPDSGKPLSARTVRHILATLRGALDSALHDGLVKRNVALAVNRPPLERKQMKVFTAEQARAFLNAIKGDRLEALFTTAIALGYRQGEALGLQQVDVDLEAGKVTIRQALQRVDGKLRLVPTKKDKVHSVSLPSVTISALVSHRYRQEQQRLIAGSAWRETGFEFTTTIGTPIDARSVIRRFHSILKRAALPRIRFHDLRHSVATLLLAQGVSPKYISDLLGHSQVSFTMQTYAHVIEGVQKETAAKMDEILNPTPVATSVATKAVQPKLN